MQQHEESHAPLSPSFARADDEPPQLAVGKRTLDGGGDAATIARHGVAGPGQPLPHLATLQRAFGCSSCATSAARR